MGVIVLGNVPVVSPFTPLLLSPASGAYVDLTNQPIFEWQYNPAVAGNTQTGWAFQVSYTLNNATVVQWWDVSTNNWSNTVVYNTTGTSNVGNAYTYQFPSLTSTAVTPFQDLGLTQWTVSCQDVNGVSPFASYNLINAQAPPVITSVTATAGTASPTIGWTVTFAPTAVQLTYEVIIYTPDQWGASGFQPGVGPNLFDSGAVGDQYTNTLPLQSVPLYLQNGVNYRAYVQVSQTGAQFSAWTYANVTPAYMPPAAQPIFAADGTDGTTGCPLIALAVGETPYGNILSVDDANPTLGVGTWTEYENCVVTSDPTYGLVLTPTGTNFSASTGFYAVTPNTTYTLTFTLYSSGAGEDGVGFVQGYTSSHGFTNGYAITGVTDQTFPTPTTSIVTFTTGPDDAFVEAWIEYPFAGTIPHYVQEIGIIKGTVDAWEPGQTGSSFTGEVIIQRSDGAYVRNASIANPASVTDSSLAISDYEAVPTVEYTYTAYILQDFGGGITAISSPTTSNSVTLITTGWWELLPNEVDTAINAQVIEWAAQVTEQSTAHLVLGQATPNVVTNTMGKTDGTATFETFDPTVYNALENLLQSQSTVFVSSPWGPVDTAYVRFGPQTGGSSSGTGNKVKDSTLLPSTFANMHRTTAVTWVAQARPPV